MPMARRTRNYKQVKVKTMNVGSAGAQIYLGKVEKLDPQSSMNGWLNNIRFSALLNDPSAVDSRIGGFIAYLTTDNVWDDSNVITARAGNFSDTVNLTGRRTIRQNTDQVSGNTGAVHLFIEITDIGTSSNEMRVIAETWGHFIKFDWA